MTPPELILYGGSITTLDEHNPQVQALASFNGRIIALGTNEDVTRLAESNTVIIDLAGRRAIPGIIDSHCHPDTHAARIVGWHDLSPDKVSSRNDLLDLIGDTCATLEPQEWFAGYRLNENKSGGYPSIFELDEACQGHPLFILRTDGHLGVANHAAFAACEIDENTPDPKFGRFDRHSITGKLTGLVREAAAHLFLREIHRHDTAEKIADGLRTVFDDFLSHGITTVYNSLTSRIAIEAYQLMKRLAWLKLRVGIIVSGREDGLIESYIRAGIHSGFGDDWVKIIGVEWCPDCSTSGRTAAYYEPYRGQRIEGEPDDNTGLLLYDREDLTERALAAHRAGLQVMIEGVGDRGIDFALDVIEHCLEVHPKENHRMRVEHCCYVTPPIQDRLKRLAVIDSSATGFMYELGDAYIANRGAHSMQWMWPHRALIDQGIIAPGHSDAWVCSPNPFTAMWSMVNRRTDTDQSLGHEQGITTTEALRAYTTLGAYSGQEEHLKGTLQIGKLTDIAVLDRDLFTIDPENIRDIKVDITIVNGKVVYRRQNDTPISANQ